MEETEKKKNIFKRVGPALVTASLVVGPGSVTVATKSGALHGYSLLFVLPLLWLFMCTYTFIGAKIGLASTRSPLTAIAETIGRPVAIFFGIATFYICSIFQAGDVIGVSAALSAVTGLPTLFFNLFFPIICIILYYKSPNVYQWIEKLMLVMIITMLGSFILNLLWAKPVISEVAAGFSPHMPTAGEIGLLSAMTATNFVVAAAFYQSYLVKEKGWKEGDGSSIMADTVFGISLLFIIVGVITVTSAAVLKPKGIVVNSAADMAMQLEPLLGVHSKVLFSLGLFAASFSSLAVNALTGATLLSDGLGQGHKLSDTSVKRYAAIIMLIGVVIAIITGSSPVKAIITLQRMTLLPVPFMALGMIWLVNSRRMNTTGKRLPLLINIVAF
ncbi:MAG: divalent metal cation transporter, partial [Fibrobacteres bacterium]|nr:divalent metal cation transporter [Fibrobacterota bacterium]